MKDLITYSNQLITEQSEELIIEEAKKNPQKFEVLYVKYYNPIFRMVYKRIGDKDITCELVSNTFFNALQTIHKFEYQGKTIYFWLYRIALNQCHEYFRKQGGRRIVELVEHHYNLLANEIEMDNHEQNRHLKHALSKLNEGDLQLVELRFFEQLKFKQISEITGMTEANCKVKLYRILEKMKKFMRYE